MKPVNRQHQVTRAGALLLLLIFTALTYLQMCIASLHDNYQEGMQAVQFFLTPFWLMALLFGLLLCFPKHNQLLRLAMWFYRGALAVIVLLFVLMLIIDNIPSASVWSHPDTRNLYQTLFISVTNPDFSGRSLAVLGGNAILLIMLAIIVEWRRHKTARDEHWRA